MSCFHFLRQRRRILSSVKLVIWWIRKESRERKNVIIVQTSKETRRRLYVLPTHSLTLTPLIILLASAVVWIRQFDFFLIPFFFFIWRTYTSFDLCAAIVTAHSAVDHEAADIFWVVELFELCVSLFFFFFFFNLRSWFPVVCQVQRIEDD